MNSSTKYLFLDTNILLHYKFFTQVDWQQIAETKDVCLVICIIVFDELEDKRHDSRKHIRKRVRALTPVFEDIANDVRPSGLKTGVSVLLLDLLEDPEQLSTGLNLKRKDDQIILQMRCFKARQNSIKDNIALVSDDSRLRIRAMKRGILAIALPDELLEEHEDERVKQLERQLKLLQDRIPKLNLRFSNCPNHRKKTFKLGTQKKISEEDINRVLTAVRMKCEDSHYLAEYKKYLQKLSNYYEHYRKTIGLSFLLHNGGTSIATRIHTHLRFPPTMIINTKNSPKPTLPEEPRYPNKFGFAAVFPNISAGITSIDWSAIRPAYARDHDCDILNDGVVHYYDKELNHNLSVTLDTIFITFPEGVLPHSFDIKYEINAAEMPQPVVNKLHIEIV